MERLALLVLALLSVGCASNRPYHLGEAPQRTTVTLEDGRKDIYRLAHIEFDEQGDFWERGQLQRAVHEIRNTGRGILLVTYIHGWQNNSRGQDAADVEQFEKLLARLVNSKRVQDSGLQVFGAYLGWRGRVVHKVNPVVDAATWIAKQSSFYSRKNAATRIAANTPITEAIFSLIRTARKDTPDSRCIVIGHSFGALVLEKALSQAMVGTLLYEEPPSRGAGPHRHVTRVYKPADLILLVNSAGESIYSKEMIDMFGENTLAGGAPQVISITSKTDLATKIAFPVGTRLSNAPRKLTGNFRTYDREGKRESQYLYFTRTPGHQPGLRSHVAEPIEHGSALPDDPFEFNLAHGGSDPRNVTFYTGKPTDWTKWRFAPTGLNQTNYWIVQVPDEIIHGHGGIFNDNALDMMAGLFRLVTKPAAREQTLEVRVKESSGGPTPQTQQSVGTNAAGATTVTKSAPSAR